VADDDVENFTAALPHLETCLGLASLEFRFSALTIAGDIQRPLDDDPGRDAPIYKAEVLSVGYLSLGLCEDGVRMVAKGFVDIFPCLKKFGVDRD